MQYIHRKDVINPSYLSRLNKIVGGQNGFPWYFISEDISYDDATDMKFGDTELRHNIPEKEQSIGFVHLLLDQGGVESPWLPYFLPLTDAIQDSIGYPVEFFRLRLALITDICKNGHHNAPHTDHEEDHYAALFYLHDSNGDTTFFDQYDDPKSGTVDQRWWKARSQEYTIQKRGTPEANSLFVFDGHQFHASSNPYGEHKYRVTLNINFRCEHDIFTAS